MCEGVGAGGEGRKAVSLFEPHVRLSAPSPSNTHCGEGGYNRRGLVITITPRNVGTSHQLLPL